MNENKITYVTCKERAAECLDEAMEEQDIDRRKSLVDQAHTWIALAQA